MMHRVYRRATGPSCITILLSPLKADPRHRIRQLHNNREEMDTTLSNVTFWLAWHYAAGLAARHAGKCQIVTVGRLRSSPRKIPPFMPQIIVQRRSSARLRKALLGRYYVTRAILGTLAANTVDLISTIYSIKRIRTNTYASRKTCMRLRCIAEGLVLDLVLCLCKTRNRLE
ncbi:hypothetical protein F5Y06DRAFT_189461 [Hypoxylon sp. FL0890]|nr:hypothetical protein F5Y06DRAFT_189461 [Hypoxylon sp. FL0890]